MRPSSDRKASSSPGAPSRNLGLTPSYLMHAVEGPCLVARYPGAAHPERRSPDPDLVAMDLAHLWSFCSAPPTPLRATYARRRGGLSGNFQNQRVPPFIICDSLFFSSRGNDSPVS